ncbi:MAG: dolichol-phosphate mannosyltransferase [Alteromonas naphthalenivorans]|jgi:dolichol-phosphate mannosyltransferase
MKKQSSNPPKLSIVVPVFNEGDSLKIILKIFKALVDIDHELLITYDIPEDNSIPVVKAFESEYPGLRLVYNQRGRGVINAVKSGVAASRGEYILIIAADDIGPIPAINNMVALMDQGCDFINGTRQAYGGKNVGGAFIGKQISTLANYLFYHLAGGAFTDPTFGVKMFHKEVFEQLHLEANPVGWAFSFELAIKVQMLGVRLGEYPIVSVNRMYGGESSLHVIAWCREYIKWFFWGIKELRSSNYQRSKIVIKVPLGAAIK